MPLQRLTTRRKDQKGKFEKNSEKGDSYDICNKRNIFEATFDETKSVFDVIVTREQMTTTENEKEIDEASDSVKLSSKQNRKDEDCRLFRSLYWLIPQLNMSIRLDH
ncbi:hypothetical protein DINM_005427 [Dirofilaria immitis]|nr:hypothetical protein [Dirofilaria immitis]